MVVLEVRSIREVGPGRLWVLVTEGSGKSVLMKYVDTTMMKRLDLELQNQDNSNNGKSIHNLVLDLIDTTEDKLSLYYVSPSRALNRLCTRTDAIQASRSVLNNGEMFLGILCKRGHLYGFYQTAIGETFISLINSDLMIITNIGLNQGTSIIDVPFDNPSLAVGFGIKSMKKISFFSAYNLKDRSVSTQTTSQPLSLVRHFKFVPWAREPEYEVLVSSGNSIYLVIFDARRSSNFFRLERQLLVFPSGNIHDVSWVSTRDGNFDLLCLNSEGTLARLKAIRNVLF